MSLDKFLSFLPVKKIQLLEISEDISDEDLIQQVKNTPKLWCRLCYWCDGVGYCQKYDWFVNLAGSCGGGYPKLSKNYNPKIIPRQKYSRISHYRPCFWRKLLHDTWTPHFGFEAKQSKKLS